MIFQSNGWSCGAAALANALTYFGKSISEKTAIRICKSNINGTDADFIIEAAKGLGYKSESFLEVDSKTAWSKLYEQIHTGTMLILCIDSWGHYVTLVGYLGSKVLIVDSSRDTKKLNGVMYLSKRQLLKRWRHENGFYAIKIWR
jgi:ABC-type bacteriocin/lantibiotic exporter with double-glycine peptidase domain